MTLNSIAGRKTRVTLAALTIAAVAIPTTAEAGRRTRTAVGVGLAAGIAGLAIGSAAARDRDYYEDDRRVYYRERRRPRCWTEKRPFEDRFGDIYYKRVEVCR